MLQSIAMNAGVEGAVVVGELLKQDKSEIGYDAQTAQYVNMFQAGIIDPTKVKKRPSRHLEKGSQSRGHGMGPSRSNWLLFFEILQGGFRVITPCSSCMCATSSIHASLSQTD